MASYDVASNICLPRAWQTLLTTSSNALTIVYSFEWLPMTLRVMFARPYLHISTAAQRYVVHARVRYLVVMRHLQSLITLLQRPLRRGLHSSTFQLSLSAFNGIGRRVGILQSVLRGYQGVSMGM